MKQSTKKKIFIEHVKKEDKLKQLVVDRIYGSSDDIIKRKLEKLKNKYFLKDNNCCLNSCYSSLFK